jgi:hypothetical protein
MGDARFTGSPRNPSSDQITAARGFRINLRLGLSLTVNDAPESSAILARHVPGGRRLLDPQSARPRVEAL